MISTEVVKETTFPCNVIQVALIEITGKQYGKPIHRLEKSDSWPQRFCVSEIQRIVDPESEHGSRYRVGMGLAMFPRLKSGFLDLKPIHLLENHDLVPLAALWIAYSESCRSRKRTFKQVHVTVPASNVHLLQSQFSGSLIHAAAIPTNRGFLAGGLV